MYYLLLVFREPYDIFYFSLSFFLSASQHFPVVFVVIFSVHLSPMKVEKRRNDTTRKNMLAMCEDENVHSLRAKPMGGYCTETDGPKQSVGRWQWLWVARSLSYCL